MHSDGIIVILAYPDTIVQPAYWEFSSKLWPFIGIGTKHTIRAGHAAILLIKKNQPEVNYFDFGRYITSYGTGRIRSKETDPELQIPIKATFKNNKLTNLNQLILWLETHPEKTHGEGRLIVSTNHAIDFKKATDFIHLLMQQKEIPYGAFIKNGSNCARFVTDILINSCTTKKIKKKLKKSYLLTPSPIGNILKGATEKEIQIVINQKITAYNNTSILKEYKQFFKPLDKKLNLLGTQLPHKEIFNLSNGNWLSGIGSGAWFSIEEQLPNLHYKIARYNFKGEKDFEGVFFTDNTLFDPTKKHTFVHPTNCIEPVILQNNIENVFKKKI